MHPEHQTPEFKALREKHLALASKIAGLTKTQKRCAAVLEVGLTDDEKRKLSEGIAALRGE